MKIDFSSITREQWDELMTQMCEYVEAEPGTEKDKPFIANAAKAINTFDLEGSTAMYVLLAANCNHMKLGFALAIGLILMVEKNQEVPVSKHVH